MSFGLRSAEVAVRLWVRGTGRTVTAVDLLHKPGHGPTGFAMSIPAETPAR
jgi:hypothetical protein